MLSGFHGNSGRLTAVLERTGIEARLENMRLGLGEIQATELVQVEAHLRELAEEVQNLPPRTKAPKNLFALFGQRYRERAHSNILAYLLNPRESHGLSTRFLEKLLTNIGVECEADALAEATVKREVPAGRAIADIVIEMPGKTVVIENKVRAREHAEQTVRMEQGFSNSSRYGGDDIEFVYLTKDPDIPDSEAFMPVQYDIVLSCLEEIPLSPLSDLPIATQVLLANFAQHLREDFYSMSGFKEELSHRAQLYLRYKEEIEEVRQAFEEDVEAIRQWFEVVEDLLPPGDWEFRPRPTFQQLFKSTWGASDYFVHYEVFLGELHVSEHRFTFVLEVEGSRKDDILALTDGIKKDIAARLESVDSTYRPDDRDRAIAHKRYSLEPDLSDLREQLRRAFDEHLFLVPIVDEVLEELI